MKRNIVFLFGVNSPKKKTFLPLLLNEEMISFRKRLRRLNGEWHLDIDWNATFNNKIGKHVVPSVLMRCFMTANIIAKSKPKNISIVCTTNFASIKGSVVIVSKFLCDRKSVLEKLQKRNNIIIADVVETFVTQECLGFFDAILCCSRSGYAYHCAMQNKIPVFFVEHCTDLRISGFNSRLSYFSPAYFGGQENIFIPKKMQSSMPIYITDWKGCWIRCLHWVNFHYAVRPEMEDLTFKPFTKGLTAALCDCNMLIHQNDGDAKSYLGDDYPYIIIAVRLRDKKKVQNLSGVW